jgi:hypothetical protein
VPPADVEAPALPLSEITPVPVAGVEGIEAVPVPDRVRAPVLLAEDLTPAEPLRAIAAVAVVVA